MVFESLYESMLKNELLLIDGGMCRFHITQERRLTIKEIISTRKGAGSELLEKLKAMKPFYILAKCPVDLESNNWYKKKGFKNTGTEFTRTKRELNIWIWYI